MDVSSFAAIPGLIDVTPEDLHRRLMNGAVHLIDVREPSEFADGHIPGAILRPMAHLTPADLCHDPGRIVLYCRSGRRSAIAAQQLFEQGLNHDITHLQGGILAWKAVGYNTLEIKA